MANIHFIIDIRIEFSSLSDPETLAFAKSEETGDFAKVYIIASSERCSNLH